MKAKGTNVPKAEDTFSTLREALEFRNKDRLQTLLQFLPSKGRCAGDKHLVVMADAEEQFRNTLRMLG